MIDRENSFSIINYVTMLEKLKCYATKSIINDFIKILKACNVQALYKNYFLNAFSALLRSKERRTQAFMLLENTGENTRTTT